MELLQASYKPYKPLRPSRGVRYAMASRLLHDSSCVRSDSGPGCVPTVATPGCIAQFIFFRDGMTVGTRRRDGMTVFRAKTPRRDRVDLVF